MPPPPGTWTGPQAVEVTYPPTPPPPRVVDPAYGMEVLQGDFMDPPNFGDFWLTGGGPWGGIAPHSTVTGGGLIADTFHLVLYNPWEYSGLPNPPGPSGYVNGEGILYTDIVIWDETGKTFNAPPGGPGTDFINLRIWLY